MKETRRFSSPTVTRPATRNELLKRVEGNQAARVGGLPPRPGLGAGASMAAGLPPMTPARGSSQGLRQLGSRPVQPMQPYGGQVRQGVGVAQQAARASSGDAYAGGHSFGEAMERLGSTATARNQLLPDAQEAWLDAASQQRNQADFERDVWAEQNRRRIAAEHAQARQNRDENAATKSGLAPNRVGGTNITTGAYQPITDLMQVQPKQERAALGNNMGATQLPGSGTGLGAGGLQYTPESRDVMWNRAADRQAGPLSDYGTPPQNLPFAHPLNTGDDAEFARREQEAHDEAQRQTFIDENDRARQQAALEMSNRLGRMGLAPSGFASSALTDVNTSFDRNLQQGLMQLETQQANMQLLRDQLALAVDSFKADNQFRWAQLEQQQDQWRSEFTQRPELMELNARLQQEIQSAAAAQNFEYQQQLMDLQMQLQQQYAIWADQFGGPGAGEMIMSLLGTVGGGIGGFLLSGGNPLGAMAGAGIGGSFGQTLGSGMDNA